MNKTITLYELLGLVKDGQAPKKVFYDGKWYEIDLELFYAEEDNHNKGLFAEVFTIFNDLDALNEEVEILDDEEKEIEISDYQYAKIPSYFDLQSTIRTCNENFARHNKAIKFLLKKVDRLKKEGK